MPTEEELTPLERFERVCRADEAKLAEKRAASNARRSADIEAHLASVENHNEVVRVNEEHTARRAAAREDQKVRAQIERVMVEKRRRAAAERELALTEVVDPEVMNWRGPQFDLALPCQPPQLTVKEALRQHYLTLLLPALEERAPVWWKVLSVLHEESPADLSFFELPTWQLAKQAGVAKESVRTAVTYLLEKKLIAVKHGVWDKNPNKSVHPRYRLERANG